MAGEVTLLVRQTAGIGLQSARGLSQAMRPRSTNSATVIAVSVLVPDAIANGVAGTLRRRSPVRQAEPRHGELAVREVGELRDDELGEAEASAAIVAGPHPTRTPRRSRPSMGTTRRRRSNRSGSNGSNPSARPRCARGRRHRHHGPRRRPRRDRWSRRRIRTPRRVPVASPRRGHGDEHRRRNVDRRVHDPRPED